MRIRLTTVRPTLDGAMPGADVRRDVEVVAPAGATVREVAPQLSNGSSPLFVEDRPLTGDEKLGIDPLVDGAVVGIGQPVEAKRSPGVRQLRVIGGPQAGATYPLAMGDTTIGRAEDASVRIADADLSRVHARISVSPTAVTITDEDSTNGVFIDGERVSDATCVQVGTVIRCGSSILRSVNRMPRPQVCVPQTVVASGWYDRRGCCQAMVNRPSHIRRSPPRRIACACPG